MYQKSACVSVLSVILGNPFVPAKGRRKRPASALEGGGGAGSAGDAAGDSAGGGKEVVEVEVEDEGDEEGTPKIKATLVVAPASLRDQWAEETYARTSAGALDVLLFASQRMWSLERMVPAGDLLVAATRHQKHDAEEDEQAIAMARAANTRLSDHLKEHYKPKTAKDGTLKSAAPVPMKFHVVCQFREQRRGGAGPQPAPFGNGTFFRQAGDVAATVNLSKQQVKQMQDAVLADAAHDLAPTPVPVTYDTAEVMSTADVVITTCGTLRMCGAVLGLTHNFMSTANVVITTYETLRMRGAVLKSMHWHRCVLDECQEVKAPTTAVAAMCQAIKSTHRWMAIKSTHRWMVSGTPLAGSIADLAGELAFLRVWPFTLQNDGFWERKVQAPFEGRRRDALPLVHALVEITSMRHSKGQTTSMRHSKGQTTSMRHSKGQITSMRHSKGQCLMETTSMRHSKGQKYLDGRPLLELPARTIEWAPVRLGEGDPSELYVYAYLELLCRGVCAHVMRTARGAPARRDYLRLQGLLSLLQKAAVHPSLVRIQTLDTLKRSLAPGTQVAKAAGGANAKKPSDMIPMLGSSR
ncbi:SNF2 family N-terminal domain-containing protein [Tribonema minus]|uniref:SNF2 family N-terminal domain-containing protein n=1 Tax=Tribonema minus TaxID=303371 RepID=A0A835Z4V2_9STRA|nr:SNF2 family N-terminal domain-containing protein [Tribonema minus]